jgi:hypothetical protein
MASWEQYLKKIYYNSSNPASFAGPDKLYRFVIKDGKFVLSKYKIKKISTTTGTRLSAKTYKKDLSKETELLWLA